MTTLIPIMDGQIIMDEPIGAPINRQELIVEAIAAAVSFAEWRVEDSLKWRDDTRLHHIRAVAEHGRHEDLEDELDKVQMVFQSRVEHSMLQLAERIQAIPA